MLRGCEAASVCGLVGGVGDTCSFGRLNVWAIAVHGRLQWTSSRYVRALEPRGASPSLIGYRRLLSLSHIPAVGYPWELRERLPFSILSWILEWRVAGLGGGYLRLIQQNLVSTDDGGMV